MPQRDNNNSIAQLGIPLSPFLELRDKITEQLSRNKVGELHFEHIWNAAEAVAKQKEVQDKPAILQSIQESAQGILDAKTKDDYDVAIGKMLYGLCWLCEYLEEKEGKQINSAVALAVTLEERRDLERT